METKKTSWENIVFEYRNKDYGAFRLRNLYPRNISIAIISVVTGYLMLFLVPTLFGKSEKIEPTSENESTKIVYYAELAPPPPIEKTYVPPPKTVDQSTIQKVVKYVAPKLTTEEVNEVEDIPTVEEVSSNVIGTQNIEGTGNIVYNEPIRVEAPVATEPKPEVAEKKVVYNFVQKQPEFPGGQGALFKYLHDNIVYPQLALENGVQGMVVMQFTVNENGELSDLTIIKSVNQACDEEAIRVVKNMPRWIAGEQNGKKVSVRFTIPIRFIIN